MYVPRTDWLLHHIVGGWCTLIGLAAGVLAVRYGMSASPIWCGLLACFIAAVLREAWNRRWGGKFDLQDIAATMSGAAPVLAAFWLGGVR